jgi:hypothetical protein
MSAETLGQDVPSGVPDILYSHVDSKAQKSDVASHVLLYTYGHADPKTGQIEPISPGAHLHVEPGEKLDINVIYGYESTNDFDIRSLKKKPVLKGWWCRFYRLWSGWFYQSSIFMARTLLQMALETM